MRKDFMQLLMQLRNNGKVGEDGDWTVQHSDLLSGVNPKNSLTINECAAQLFIFYIAGFDATSSALSYSLFELARNPDVMRKLQTEIDETLSRHKNEVTYDAIQEMKYLDLCMSGKVR